MISYTSTLSTVLLISMDEILICILQLIHLYTLFIQDLKYSQRQIFLHSYDQKKSDGFIITMQKMPVCIILL